MCSSGVILLMAFGCTYLDTYLGSIFNYFHRGVDAFYSIEKIDSPKDFSKNSGTFSPLPRPVDLHFPPKNGLKLVSNVKTSDPRSMIWIKTILIESIKWF